MPDSHRKRNRAPDRVPAILLLPTGLVDALIGSYLLLTGLLIFAFRQEFPDWGFYAALHFPLGSAAFFLRGRRFPGFPGFLRDWYPVILFPLLYKEVETLAGAFGNWGLTEIVQQCEIQLFSGNPYEYLSLQFPWLWLSEYLHFCYFTYLFLIPVVGGYWYFRNQRPPFEELLLSVSLVFSLSYLFYILFPVNSPFYLADPLNEPLSQGYIYKLVHFFSARGGAHGGAFPSAHVSISTVVWLVCWKWDRKLGKLLTLVIPGIYLATVYGRFHYALDVLAGWILAIVVFLLVQLSYRRLGAFALKG
jgi:membrane-associated phospholipid phosphatase